MGKFKLPCSGDSKEHKVPKKDTVTFVTDGTCKFISFNFVGNPSCFKNRHPPSGGGSKISYDYDGSPIPATGYRFDYSTDAPMKGNGTGVIKN